MKDKLYDPEKTNDQLTEFINKEKRKGNTVDLSNNYGHGSITIYQTGDDVISKELFDLYGRDKNAAKVMLNSLIADVGLIKKDLEDQNSLIASKNETINALNDEIASLKEERSYLQKRLDEFEGR